MSLKLLKFDTINPQNYLIDEIKRNYEQFRNMKSKEVRDWIISTRGNFSDFYTYNLRNLGWEAEEFFVNDYYIDKIADELYGNKKSFLLYKSKLKDKIRPIKNRWNLEVIIDYIAKYKPDVILVREKVGIRSDFWKNFSNKALIVSRLAAPIPKLWSPTDWDIILTSTDAYKNFFKLNGVSSYINHNGFDERILGEMKEGEKKYDVTFVGGVGSKFWSKRTKAIEFIADKVNFKWWGYKGDKYPADHPVNSTWQGLTIGLEMLQIYKDSKIVFNDYGEIADGQGVNQRMFEVMGVGSLLLTREAENLKHEYPDNIFVTFKNEQDCLEKINYYLKNEKEREEIAKAGQKYVLKNFTYDKLMEELDVQLKEGYSKKFPQSGKILSTVVAGGVFQVCTGSSEIVKLIL
ncbi:MAG: glycosyltransferase [bacterium]|nr:glycosyltransferase [bacterium]